MTRAEVRLAVGVLVCAAMIGCGGTPPPPLPPAVGGTVSQFASYMMGSMDRPLQGYGLVVGLGASGSRDAPPKLREYLVKYLEVQKMGFRRHGTKHMNPGMIIRDPDTAVVLIAGSVPTGAPAGTRFDLRISSLAGTGTTNLDGGRLMTSEMRRAVRGLAPYGGPTQPWAKAGGEVFVDPFIDPSKPSQAGRLREGWILGGGLLKKEHPVRLVLTQKDYVLCRAIQQRINERFRDARGNVAQAKNPSVIELRTPLEYRHDYRRFLALVLRLVMIRGAAATDLHVRRTLEAMHKIGATHEHLALALEAVGKEIIDTLKPYYRSENAAVAFYTARTGLRLGDRTALETILRAAQTMDSKLQLPAVAEIARHKNVRQAVPILRKLLDDENDVVRIAAYEALLEQRDYFRVRPMSLSKYVALHAVKSSGKPVIYATRAKESRIILFGDDLKVKRPVFFSLPDDLITLSSVENDSKLMIYRKVARARGNLYSEPTHLSFSVAKLIQVLGAEPTVSTGRTFRGLGLTYSQILRVLSGLCREKHIDAEFVLQRPDALQRIYRGVGAVERSEAPE